jgi:8-oxo-dGTP diphosphatase
MHACTPHRWPRPAVTVDAAIVAKPCGARPAELLLIKRKFEPFKDAWALPGGFVNENEGLDAAAARELHEETSVDPSSVLLTQVRRAWWDARTKFCIEAGAQELGSQFESEESVLVTPAPLCSPLYREVQVGSFGDPGRDPRGWTITVAYAALVPDTNLGVKAAVRCKKEDEEGVRFQWLTYPIGGALQDDAREASWFSVGELPMLAFDHKLIVRETFRTLAGRPEAAGALAKALTEAASKLEGPWKV